MIYKFGHYNKSQIILKTNIHSSYGTGFPEFNQFLCLMHFWTAITDFEIVVFLKAYTDSHINFLEIFKSCLHRMSLVDWLYKIEFKSAFKYQNMFSVSIFLCIIINGSHIGFLFVISIKQNYLKTLYIILRILL